MIQEKIFYISDRFLPDENQALLKEIENFRAQKQTQNVQLEQIMVNFIFQLTILFILFFFF